MAAPPPQISTLPQVVLPDEVFEYPEAVKVPIIGPERSPQNGTRKEPSETHSETHSKTHSKRHSRRGPSKPHSEGAVRTTLKKGILKTALENGLERCPQSATSVWVASDDSCVTEPGQDPSQGSFGRESPRLNRVRLLTPVITSCLSSKCPSRPAFRKCRVASSRGHPRSRRAKRLQLLARERGLRVRDSCIDDVEKHLAQPFRDPRLPEWNHPSARTTGLVATTRS